MLARCPPRSAARVRKRIVHGRCAAIDPAWMEEDVEVSWRMSRENGLEIDVRQVSPPAHPARASASASGACLPTPRAERC